MFVCFKRKKSNHSSIYTQWNALCAMPHQPMFLFRYTFLRLPDISCNMTFRHRTFRHKHFVTRTFGYTDIWSHRRLELTTDNSSPGIPSDVFRNTNISFFVTSFKKHQVFRIKVFPTKCKYMWVWAFV